MATLALPLARPAAPRPRSPRPRCLALRLALFLTVAGAARLAAGLGRACGASRDARRRADAVLDASARRLFAPEYAHLAALYAARTADELATARACGIACEPLDAGAAA